jgi:hypothetical protein
MKYHITKTDGTPINPNARYFVLRLDGEGEEADAARGAVAQYAVTVRRANPEAADAASAALSYALSNTVVRDGPLGGRSL